MLPEPTATAAATAPLAPDTLYRFAAILRHDAAPDGRHVVFSVQRIDQKTEKKHSDLWVVETSGTAEPRRFTYGDTADNAPRWSPDGRQIAFLSNRDDERQAQLYLLPFDGGEARKLTDLKGQIQAYAWSPDGTRIALLFRPKAEEELARETDEQKKKLGVVVRHITRVTYKEDGVGFLPSTYAHLWLLDPADGTLTQITTGEHDIEDVSWSPDGARLVFAANLHPDPDFNYDATQIYSVPARPSADGPWTAADYTQITDHLGRVWAPVYSPDGRQIAFFGREQLDNWWQNTSLYVVSAAGGEARNLTQPHDLHVSCATLGDIAGGGTPQAPPTWSADGRALYFQASRHGDQPLYGVDVASGALTELVGEKVVGLFQFDRTQTRLIYLAADGDNPGELFCRDLATGTTQQLTHQHAWLTEQPLGRTEMVWVPTADGYRIQTWIMTPPDFDPARRYPTLLSIHGGPQMQYGNFYMHEFHLLASHGFVVVYSNPRGGQGYGNAHSRAIHGRWGTVDYDDLTAVADYAAGLPYVDAARMGVLGGSYGGFMTALIITRTHRFKAACTERAVSNWTSMWGSADFNYGWTKLVGLPHPWEDFQRNWEQSPMSRIGHVRTPTLVIHSAADYRTNLEQSEQIYVALKVLGVESEMLIFPDEGHGLNRSGRTDRRVARLQHLVRWFTRHLGEGA